jgi:hypothetical protein
MTYDQYKFDPEWVKSEVIAKQARVKENLGVDANLLKNAIKVFADRLKKDKLRYRDYGCYWWAVKSVLNVHGVTFGTNDDPLMKAAYKGETPIETLVMAEAFRDMYLSEFLLYSNQFVLDSESGEMVEIFDGDME